jgi:leucyl aminopeptidase (aminopeptidase T)
LKKIKLDKESVKRKDFSTYVEEEINQEKKNVKNELKLYDSAFIKIFARPPARADKEPMRPLYMYYQNLRKAISKKAYAKAGGVAKKLQSNQSNTGSITSLGSGAGSLGSNFSNISIGANSEEDKSSSKTKIPFTEEEAKKAPPEELMKKLGLENEKELKKQIHEFMKERKHLRRVLDTFQKEFLKTYNRKLRFTKDISPVASEFKRYKELKKEIAKLENVLNNLKKKDKV